MAHSAWISTEVRCPTCSAPLTDLVWFWWGGVHGSDPNEGPIYRVGDRCLWFVADDGSVPANCMLAARAKNLGSPTIEHVDVVERSRVPDRCRACAAPIVAFVVEIRDGLIQRCVAVSDSDKYEELAYVAYADSEATSITELGREDEPLRRFG